MASLTAGFLAACLLRADAQTAAAPTHELGACVRGRWPAAPAPVLLQHRTSVGRSHGGPAGPREKPCVCQAGHFECLAGAAAGGCFVTPDLVTFGSCAKFARTPCSGSSGEARNKSARARAVRAKRSVAGASEVVAEGSRLGRSVGSGRCSGASPARVTQLEQAFRGYNIYKGNPLAADFDPGFGAFVFKEQYKSNSTTGDCLFQKPDGMDLVSEPACSFSFQSRSVSTSAQYADSLRVLAKVEGGFPFAGSFSASTEFTSFVESTTSENWTRVEYYAQCKQFRAWLSTYGQRPPFADDFQIALGTVGAAASASDAFFDVFDAFGTHFVSEVDLGARYGRVTYLTEEGVEKLEESGVSVTAAAEYSGIFSIGGSTETETAKTTRTTFASATAHESQISVGVAPPLGDDGEALVEWELRTRERPLPMGYTLIPICELVPSEAKAACEAAARDYCSARLSDWRANEASGFSHAFCEATTTTTTTTTIASTACRGCPPRCCSGGCAGARSQKQHDNSVKFEGYSGIGKDSITVTWSMDTCSVTGGQPFGEGSSQGVERGGAKNELRVNAGRKKSGESARAFCDGLEASNLLGIFHRSATTPKELNFAFRGTLTLAFDGHTATFPDFRLGKGNGGSRHNWWIGSPDCRHRGSGMLSCKSQEGTYLQFREGNGQSWIFEVTFG